MKNHTSVISSSYKKSKDPTDHVSRGESQINYVGKSVLVLRRLTAIVKSFQSASFYEQISNVNPMLQGNIP